MSNSTIKQTLTSKSRFPTNTFNSSDLQNKKEEHRAKIKFNRVFAKLCLEFAPENPEICYLFLELRDEKKSESLQHNLVFIYLCLFDQVSQFCGLIITKSFKAAL